MNQLKGTITEIQSHEGLSLVKVKTINDIIFTSIVLDDSTTADWLVIGKIVKLLFKETEVIISKNVELNISIQNKLSCIIQSLNIGAILGQVNLLFGEIMICSIITANACRQLGLKENDHVLALIKTNEISISPDD
jgi:molybdate transport system regulatory protein